MRKGQANDAKTLSTAQDVGGVIFILRIIIIIT
jgi:hypothetical protein